MPGIDLSTLTAPELRQLLRLARARRDGLLIDRVEWEMAQRAALSSRVGVDVERKAPLVIEDGDVTIDEVRAFRRPEPGLPPKRSGGGRLAAGLGGMVAGSVLTTGAFAWAQGTDGWRLPMEIPALPALALAERAPPPKPVAPPTKPHATSDAVAGVLAPEPFPPAEPVEVAEIPPPPPVAAEPEPAVEPVAVVAPAPLPKPEVAEAARAKVVKAKSDKPETAKPKVQKAKTEPAKAKPKDAAVKTAKARTPTIKAKTQLATKPKVTKTAATKPKTATKLAAAKSKPTKVAAAKAKPAKAGASKAAQTKLAKKDAKPAPKPPAKAKAQVVAKQDAIDVLLAKTNQAAR